MLVCRLAERGYGKGGERGVLLQVWQVAFLHMMEGKKAFGSSVSLYITI